jgi:hypothetical protein
MRANKIAQWFWDVGNKNTVRLEIESYARKVKKGEWRRAYRRQWFLYVLGDLLAGPRWWKLIPNELSAIFRRS